MEITNGGMWGLTLELSRAAKQLRLE